MPVSHDGILGLSAEKRAIFFEVIEPTQRISNQEQFFQWTRNELQRLFPHGMLACGFGSISKKGVKVQHVMSCNFPQEYLQTLQCPNEMMNSPILSKWMQDKQPILFEPNYGGITENVVQSAWLDNFHRFGLQNLAAHGQCDVNSQTASYFSFSSIPSPLSPRHAGILKLLVPHLHFALCDRAEPSEPGGFADLVTLPVAFDDYFASDDFGETWRHVARGTPAPGQWVSRAEPVPR